jgi:hypothetical protein
MRSHKNLCDKSQPDAVLSLIISSLNLYMFRPYVARNMCRLSDEIN